MVTNDTPLAMMTFGQLKEALSQSSTRTQEPADKKYVYGIEGICSLFNCRRNVAISYKNTIIKDAVFQHGRKIVVDANKAIQLFEAAAKAEK